eukprot:m.269506 g.269506  ORF g.269506 m.269506 type:complete len:408 (+) comp84705_c0_seq1:158-1381(+)
MLLQLNVVALLTTVTTVIGVPSERCYLNGEFVDGVCKCKPHWVGELCERLELQPHTAHVIEPTASTTPIAISSSSQPWTWGGSPIFDATTSTYHMFYSSMTRGCGLLHYQTNSVVLHAVAKTPLGPWMTQAQPALQPRPHHWDSGAIHGPEIHFDASTRVWLLFYMGTHFDGATPDCNANVSAPIIDVSSTRRIGLAWSASLESGKELWHRFDTPILSPRPKPFWDWTDVSNAAPLVFPNGSVLMGYRGGGDGVALGGGIGMAFASSWNATFERRSLDGDGGQMLFAAEDGTMWRDSNDNTFHMLVHRFASGNGTTAGADVGGHAFSRDGWHWHFDHTVSCYNTTITWKNMTTTTLYRRERPKLLQTQSQGWFLFSGAWPCHFGPQAQDKYDTQHGCNSQTMIESIA